MNRSVISRASDASLQICLNGIRSRQLADKAWYSASIVDRAIVVCSLDTHSRGHPANVMTYPVLDLAQTGSCESSLPYNPAKSEST